MIIGETQNTVYKETIYYFKVMKTSNIAGVFNNIEFFRLDLLT
jgi:hypothetical protein